MTVRRSRCALLGPALAVTAVAAACGEPRPQSGSDPASRLPDSASTAPRVDSAPADASTERGDSIAGVSIAYDKPIDAAHRLVVEVVDLFRARSRLRLVLVDRGDTSQRWAIDSTASAYADHHVVRRVTTSEAVVCRLGGYGEERGCIKFFYDPSARRAQSHAEFSRGPLSFKDAAEAERVLAVSAAGYARLQETRMFQNYWEDETGLPRVFSLHPLPQTKDAEFAPVLKRRAARGHDDSEANIQESVGAWQADSGGYWFGKAFYDGEGFSGVGDIGFLDSSGRYSFLRLREVEDASVGALLVEPATLWAGLHGSGEGSEYSLGLLRYDRASRRAQVTDLPSVVTRILRIDGALFMRAHEGMFVMRGETMLWFQREPTANGGSAIVVDTVRRSASANDVTPES